MVCWIAAAAALAVLPSLSCAQAAQQPVASGPVLLVGNKGEDTLSFIDLSSGKEIGRSPTGKWPHEIAISSDGNQAAVVAYGGNTIDIFDIGTRAKLKTIDLGPNDGPHGLVWLKDGRLIATTERSQSLAVVDVGASSVAASIKTNQRGTHMVVVSPDAQTAYTSNIPAGTVSVIDLANNRKLRDITVGGKPEGIALSIDGKTLWVADLESPRVQAFDTRSFAKLAEVGTGDKPIRVAASPDGRWIVTSNLGSGSLTVIDAATRERIRDIPISGSGEAGQATILFSANGRRIYAAETGTNTVAEVDVESGKVLRRLAAGENGDGLAIAR